jgi:hypothetical protein
MGSLVTTESQVTRLTPLPKDSTLHRAMSPITALGHWDIFLDQKSASYWTSNTTSSSILSPIQGPTLLSFRGNLAVGCMHAY